MGALVKTLREMEMICAASNVYNRTGCLEERQSVTARTVCVAYTDVEEKWLTKQLNIFEVSVVHYIIRL